MEARMKKLFAVLCLLALAIVICCGHAFAQATASASLTGTVIDQSQAVVANAQITLTNKDTGAVRTVQSNSDGLYRFDLLPAGNYELKVTLAGFKTITVASTELIVGETSTLNFTLEPGSVSQTVTVTEQAPIVDVTKTNVGLDITQQQIQNMPLNGRDFGNLAYLAPGARPVNSYDPTKNRVSATFPLPMACKPSTLESTSYGNRYWAVCLSSIPYPRSPSWPIPPRFSVTHRRTRTALRPLA